MTAPQREAAYRKDAWEWSSRADWFLSKLANRLGTPTIIAWMLALILLAQIYPAAGNR